MLSMPMFIFTSSISALLGHTCCGLSIWRCYLPYSIHFSEFMPISFTRKQEKYENARSLPFLYHWYENGHWLLLHAHSINSERASLTNFSPNTRSPANFSILHYSQLPITWQEKFAFGHWAFLDEMKSRIVFVFCTYAQIKLFAAASSLVWEMAVINSQELWFYFLVFHSICLLPKHPHLVCVLTMI